MSTGLYRGTTIEILSSQKIRQIASFFKWVSTGKPHSGKSPTIAQLCCTRSNANFASRTTTCYPKTHSSVAFCCCCLAQGKKKWRCDDVCCELSLHKNMLMIKHSHSSSLMLSMLLCWWVSTCLNVLGSSTGQTQTHWQSSNLAEALSVYLRRVATSKRLTIESYIC